MHDFFVDRLVHVASLNRFLGDVAAKSREGGGGIHDVAQSEMRGGNAVNLAHALGRLGLRVLLITHSDGAHAGMLKAAFQGLDVEVRAKPYPPGLTVAFEEETNVMVADGGGAADFGPALLTQSDWAALRRSKVVCSVNWAANRRGTELLEALREGLREGQTLFLDPADVRDRRGRLSGLVKRIRDGHLVDWVSVNEFEAKAIAKAAKVGVTGASDICRGLSKTLGVKVDVHGERTAVTCEGGSCAASKVKRVEPLRRTGAGDVWDAGSIFGVLDGMKDPARLRFANAAASLYLGSKDPLPPTLRQVQSAAG